MKHILAVALLIVILTLIGQTASANIKTDVTIDSIGVNLTTIDLICTDPELKGQTAVTGYVVDIDDSALFDSIDITDSSTKTCDSSTLNSINISTLLSGTTYNLRLTVSTNNSGDSVDIDTFTTIGTIIVNLNESLGISDNLTTLSTFTIDLNESLGISDNLTKSATFTTSLNESLGVSDTLETSSMFTVDLNESLEVSDNLTTTSILTVNLDESLGILDTLTTTSTLVINLSESLQVSDTLTTTSTLIINLSESLGISDTFTTSSTLVVNLDESLGISDTLTFTTTSTLTVNINESLGISDSIEITHIHIGTDFEVTLIESLGFSDIYTTTHINVGNTFEVTLDESIGFIDSIGITHTSVGSTLEVTLIESIGFSDVVDMTLIQSIQSSDKMVTLTETLLISVTLTVNGIVMEPEPEPEVVKKKKGGGGNDEHKTRPTFGRDHNTFRQFVTDGFILNDHKITITDNFHTKYPMQYLEIGVKYKMEAKAYSSKGLKVVEFMFGIPEVGKSHEAQASVEVWLDGSRGNPTFLNQYLGVEINQKYNIIADVKSTMSRDVKCSESNKIMCEAVAIYITFAESPTNEIFGVKAIDKSGRWIITTFNDGIEFSGLSQNKLETAFMPYKKEGLVNMVLIDKKDNIWISPYGQNYTRNSVGSWFQLTYAEHMMSDRSCEVTKFGYARTCPEFDMQMQGQELLAIHTMNTLYPNVNRDDSFSEIDQIFAYEYPTTSQREQEQDQEMVAQNTLDTMYPNINRYESFYEIDRIFAYEYPTISQREQTLSKKG